MLPNCQNFSDHTRGKKAKTFPIIIILVQDDLCCLKLFKLGFGGSFDIFGRPKKCQFRSTSEFHLPGIFVSASVSVLTGFFSKPAALKREARENNLGWVALGWFRGLPKWHLISSLGFSVRNPHWLLFYNLMNRPYLMDIFFKAFLVSKYP